MGTIKLFDSDSHLRAFVAEVLSCEQTAQGYEVVLNQSAFYPEGGGQPADQGTLSSAVVRDVHEREGVIYHLCDTPLAVGTQVAGEIDWKRRFDLMQQHSGEHIVSGLVHSAYGYDNTGFHIGQDKITIDFNGEIDEQQLQTIAMYANNVVCENRPVRVFYPEEERLRYLSYRSKKELHGAVRLVEYPEIDLCACCGTHVKQTGEIGLILLLSTTKFRGGSRIEMLSGRRAAEYAGRMISQNQSISMQLSAKPHETASAVSRIQRELSSANYRMTQLENQLFSNKAAALQGAGDVLLFEPDLSPDALRRLAIAVGASCGGRAAVFSGSDESGYKYAIVSPDVNLRAQCKELNAALNGRGGGKDNFVQGSLQASEADIRAFLR